MPRGHATAEATEAYVASFPSLPYRPFAGSEWQVSAVGFGTYRVDVSVSAHHEALRYALRNGINLIDTSANYADGRAEELVGVVMRRLDDDGEVPRAAVVVAGKAGYVQGRNYQIAQQRLASGRPFPDLVSLREGVAHCIHPEFLEDQLTRSLQRLQMDKVDVYLLHNPEYYLGWAQGEGIPLEEARREYYRRIRIAFAYLEEEVQAGRIGYYGVSSNTFASPAGDPKHTSLARVWAVADEQVGAGHHFRAIQLPMNLLETGAATTPNQPQGETVLDFARERDLAVMVNRPLNAVQEDRLLRLADVAVPQAADPEAVEPAIAALMASEARLRREIIPLLHVEQSTAQELAAIFSAGALLQAQWQAFATYTDWNEMQTRFLVPRVQTGIDFISSQENPPAAASEWVHAYVATLNRAMRAVDAIYAEQGAAQTTMMKARAADAAADWGEAETLSQTAIRALRSTAGITSVLVGMRQKVYVDDVLAELGRNVDVAPRDAAWQALAAAGES